MEAANRLSFLRMLQDLGVQEPAAYLFGKTLSMSDVNTGQSRLQLTRREVENSDLPLKVPSLGANIARAVEDRARRRPPAYAARATMLNRRGEAFAGELKYIPSSNSYRVMGGWNRLARGCGMAEGQLVELWWFDARQLAGAAGQGGPEMGLAILNHPAADVVPAVLGGGGLRRDPETDVDQGSPRHNGEQAEEEPAQPHEDDGDEQAQEEAEDAAAKELLMLGFGREETRRLVESILSFRNCRPRREDIINKSSQGATNRKKEEEGE